VSYMSAMEIIASGLAASRMRMNLVSSNLTNANTTRTAEGGPYKRRDPIYQSTPLADHSFKDVLRDQLESSYRGVAVTGIVEDNRPPRTIFDPSHPDADKDGIVRLPNVNIVEEMVDMIMASRAYEAGISAMQSVKAMANKALAIGR